MKAYNSFKYGLRDRLFSGLTFASAASILIIFFGMWLVLIAESGLAIKTYGFVDFITSSEWNPSENRFGAMIPLSGTLITTCIALFIAIPVSLGIAIFIEEICHKSLKTVLGSGIELLASVPSIVFGMWGLYRLAPIMSGWIEPFLQKTFSDVPLIGGLFVGVPLGIDVLTASVILAIMIIPFITSTTREKIRSVPDLLKESSYSLGATKWEVIKGISIPYSKRGIYSGSIIALSRALGETMAVAFVLGSKQEFAESLFDATSTITVTLVNEFTSASSDVYYSALVFLALILFALNVFALLLSRIIVRRGRS